MLTLADRRVNELGISFPEYVRYLIINDIKIVTEEYASSKLENAIQEARKEIANGDYIVLKTNEDIDNLFDNL